MKTQAAGKIFLPILLSALVFFSGTGVAHAGYFQDLDCAMGSPFGSSCGGDQTGTYTYCGQTYYLTGNGLAFAVANVLVHQQWFLERMYGPCPQSDSTSTPTSPPQAPAPANINPNTTESPANTPSGGSSFTPCNSTPNACGVFNTGTLVNGVCNAEVPPNTACPVPQITFYAQPAQVRPHATSTLHWSVKNATVCDLGGGLSLSGLATLGVQDTDPIDHNTTYSLTCINGPDGSHVTAQLQVKLVPTYKEI